jgi:hypothetical protein
LPNEFKEKFFTLNLHLLDPYKQERFGDALISLIEVISGDSELAKSELIDSEEMEEDPEGKNGLSFDASRVAINLQCENALNLIDNALAEDDEAYLDDDDLILRKYNTGKSMTEEEIQRIRDQEILKEQ